MAEQLIEELISKPFLGPNSKDTYYVGVEGRTVGNDFLPAEGRSSSIVVLYKRISNQDYEKIRQRGDGNLVTTYNLQNGSLLYLAQNGVLNGNKLATNELTPPEIKQDPRKWGTIIKDQANTTVEEYNLENKTNISSATAKIEETTGNAAVQATPIVGTGNINRKNSPLLVYPSDMKDGQDRIKFSVWKHKTRDITTPSITTVGDVAGIPLTEAARESEKDISNYVRVGDSSTVYLPITKISDTGTVDWFDDSMNPLQRRLAQISLNMMTNKSNEAFDQTAQLINYTQSDEFANMVRLSLAGQAVGVGGLLARATGAAFNPNLELLFRGPQLRSFGFNFSMIAKREQDATKIKQIIKFFKKNMAVRKTASNVFLQSPYVFKVEYLSGTSEHKSLNKIKLCALQSCTVDYTPMGSYMTFNDNDKTMFMYNLSLQFRELTPIYDNDYDGDHPIGY
jgi:hypothetical protein